MKKLLGCLLFVILFLLPTGKVFAAEQPDFDKKGSIDIYMRATSGKLITGGSLEVYKVADVKKTSQGYKYVYTEEFAGSGYSLDEEDVAELATDLYSYAVDNTIQSDIYVNSTGKIKLDNIASGLYLIDNKKSPEGYTGITPFLVAMPLRVGDLWLYEVDASPKMSLLNQETISPDTKPGPTPGPVPGPVPGPEVNPGIEFFEGIEINSHYLSPATGDRSGDILGIMVCSYILVAICFVNKRKTEP